ncbi:MAG TPA: hypothetical protein PKD34_02745 [Candidatus Doudnabacteria bacterium]|nr:hypothetical protein [Candidatus Doudnabacteria bacterium]
MKLHRVRKHWKPILIILGIFFVIAGIFWYLWENQNILVNKEYRLKKTVMRYSELIEVGLHEDVFNNYLTPEAKLKTTPSRREIPITTQDKDAENNRLKACNNSTGSGRLLCRLQAYHKPQYEDIEIPAMEIFKKYAQERKDNWTDIKIEKIVYPNNNRADVKLKVTDKQYSDTAPIETWYYIDGNWLRDF